MDLPKYISVVMKLDLSSIESEEKRAPPRKRSHHGVVCKLVHQG
jgi:hypothetical protein